MAQFSIGEISQALGAVAVGDTSLRVSGAAEPADATETQLALAMDPKYAAGLAEGKARAAMLWADAEYSDFGLEAAILVPRARFAMSGLTMMLDAGPEIATGVHAMAVVDASAKIAEGAAIAAFVTIGRNVRIGRNARIDSHVSIAADTVIGDDALILSGVRIGASVRIGDRIIAQPGCVIGADGFSFVTAEKSTVETARETLGDTKDASAQSWIRIHSIGSVEIGDDVEIGANSTIDRGTVKATRVGSGTKLDNLVQVAHNVQIGRDCLLCGQVGIAGSTRIGDSVVLGGQVGVVDNISVGSGVIAGAGTMILSNAPAGRVLMGYPAVKMNSHIESYKALRRLPRLFREVERLQKSVSKHSDTE